jgi:hypothetical protein
MMLEGVQTLHSLGDELRTVGLVAASASAVCLLGTSLRPLRGRRRSVAAAKIPLPPTPELAPRRGAAIEARYGSHARDSMPLSDTAPPPAPPRPGLTADERAAVDVWTQTLGIKPLTDLAEACRWRTHAREVLVQQLGTLADEECIVEPDLELGGKRIPATLLTTRGVFVVLVADALSANDALSVETIVRRLPALNAVVDDLTARIEEPVRVDLVFFSPYATAPPRVWFDACGRQVWTVGGVAEMRQLVSCVPRRGLSRERLEAFRSAAKPRRRSRGVTIPTAGIHRG